MIYKKFIASVLNKASDIANQNFGKVTSIEKTGDNNQVLTQTDLEIGNFLIAKVKDAFPSHNIIDEEAGVIDNNSEFTWVIDPIDGTSNFANGVPTYGIMIGLLKNSTPLAGGIALPYFNQIYFAEKEAGAFCNDKKITVSRDEQLLKTLVAYGIDGHQKKPSITYDETKVLAEIILNIRNLRTSNSAFDMALVANGEYGAYLNRVHKIWDCVAPHIILEEAGAIVTDFWGKPLDYSNALRRSQKIFTYCAAPAALHKQLQEIIH